MTRVEHLYAHVPFCPRVCPYCAFHVQPADRRLAPPLVEGLLRELAFYHDTLGVGARTIFLGGGTPSALDTPSLARLVGALVESAPHLEEFTIEVNPTTLSPEKARLLRELGVTRASLGAQSFDPAALRTLGRQHGPERIVRTYEILRGAGIPRVSLDLMFGIPGQTHDAWLATLDAAIALRPDHLSTYCLTYEEDTPFLERLRRGEFVQDDARDAALYLDTIARLEAAGLRQYEVSNFAIPGREARHNLAVWAGESYLGLGPGAESTVHPHRRKNVPDTARYLAARPAAGAPHYAEVCETETVGPELAARERIVFGLRTRDGAPHDPAFSEAFARLESAGYARRAGDRWTLTTEGLLRADGIAELFL
jgi:oxygen-independent coproporphyrinogen-3 oxidase